MPTYKVEVQHGALGQGGSIHGRTRVGAWMAQTDSPREAIRKVLNAPEFPNDFKAGWEQIEVTVHLAT